MSDLNNPKETERLAALHRYDILDTPPDFVTALQLESHLSPTRSTGLSSMLTAIGAALVPLAESPVGFVLAGLAGIVLLGSMCLKSWRKKD